jgi:hypothetical protein
MSNNIQFKFNQTVMTPFGKATFIGYMIGMYPASCQVSRWVNEHGKRICRNEIYQTSQISDVDQAQKRVSHQTEPAAALPVQDVAL